MKKSISILCILIVLVNIRASAQAKKDYPVVGELVPDFTLTSITNYGSKTFSPQDVKNKWIVLDFWNKQCAPCIKSFPKINELQQEFENDIQFVLVGLNDTQYNKGIENVYERYRAALNLKIASAYDSALYYRFKVNGAPHIVIIDPQYKVYAVTYGNELTKEKLAALISGKNPLFRRKHYDFESGEVKPVEWKYELFKRDTTEDFLFRSVLSRYTGEAIRGGWIEQSVKLGSFYVTGATLPELYNIAYLGQAKWVRPWGQHGYYFTHWRYPILEVIDTSLFQSDFSSGRGMFNYSLTIPKKTSTRELMMNAMQRDLQNYFGYVVVTETRMMPYWRLTATEGARDKLISKDKTPTGERTAYGIYSKCIVVRNILETIEKYNTELGIPLIDETEITAPIDINFSASMTDITAVQKALRQHGLILEKAEKPTQVLVIREPATGN